MKKILCIDGGGARGIYAATVIMKIEEKYNIKFSEFFDVFYGVSTGSLIASMLYLGYSGKEICENYKKYSNLIFTDSASYDVFDTGALKMIVTDILKGKKIERKDKEVYVFTYNIIKSKAEIVNLSEVNETGEYILASCAAPGFFNPVEINNDKFIDGSILARNPSIYAFNNELSKGVKVKDMSFMSIGCIQGNLDKSIAQDFILNFKKLLGIGNVLKKFDKKLNMLYMLEKTLYHAIDSSIDVNDELLERIFEKEGKYLKQDFKTKEYTSINKMPPTLFAASMRDFKNKLYSEKYDEFFIEKTMTDKFKEYIFGKKQVELSNEIWEEEKVKVEEKNEIVNEKQNHKIIEIIKNYRER
ncbi:patatin-like phospholipase family protein [Streptobacillus canis]|uniref:patatin-like phospholipase family protein n=1 Tax=Streptobacillus canis TaxID=2678686 RepID=UPI0012E2ACC7|nr:patatin-like phospholipase family protein [Streptobacillus canis]